MARQAARSTVSLIMLACILSVPLMSYSCLQPAFAAQETKTWAKTYVTSSLFEAERLMSVQQTSDGGYIAAGGIGTGDAESIRLWVLKLDSDGKVEWDRTYGQAGSKFLTFDGA